jgi:hypothetical protein
MTEGPSLCPVKVRNFLTVVNRVIKQAQEKTTLRHEIIHAFIAESGLRGSSLDVSHWALNEEMVDWFALQLPKMLSVFELLDCTGVV